MNEYKKNYYQLIIHSSFCLCCVRRVFSGCEIGHFSDCLLMEAEVRSVVIVGPTYCARRQCPIQKIALSTHSIQNQIWFHHQQQNEALIIIP